MTVFVISAAGLGSRLGMNMPKCLLPINEDRLIDYQLALLGREADVRVVVGFMEREVIDHVGRRWPNVTFVRNPAFASTSNTFSLHLASRFISGPFVAIDGDLIIDTASFSAFLRHCEARPGTVIGVTPRATDEAVGVRLDEEGRVERFVGPADPELAGCALEWCGIARFDGIELTPNRRYVFEELAKHLPLAAFEIGCFEIDTPGDLERAMHHVSAIDIRMPWSAG